MQLKYNNYVAFSHVHGVAVNNSGLLLNDDQKGGTNMSIAAPMLVISLIIYAGLFGLFIYLVILIIRALKKYIRSKDVRAEKSVLKQNLGEVLKDLRTKNKMTQEFVAETIGVSRQAVSKWESGECDPSTSNLIALAKLYRTTVEEILQNIKQ